VVKFDFSLLVSHLCGKTELNEEASVKLTIIGCGAMGSALAKNLSKNTLTLFDHGFGSITVLRKPARSPNKLKQPLLKT
jgi:hypothetical protein